MYYYYNNTNYWGCSSIWLEHCPVTTEVAGSSPVSLVIKLKNITFSPLYLIYFYKIILLN